MANPAPPTSCVGESGVRSSGCCSSSACSSRSSLSNSAVGDDRRVPDVVAELVVAHLVGELLPLRGAGRRRRDRLRCRGCSAHPGRLSERDRHSGSDAGPAGSIRKPGRHADDRSQANLDAMPHPIMFRDDDFGLAEAAQASRWASRRRSRRSRTAGRCSARRRCSSMYGGSAKTDQRGEYVQYPYSILVKVDECDRKALEQDSRFFYPGLHGPVGLAGPGLHGDAEGRLGRGPRTRRRVVPVGRAEETHQAARRSLTRHAAAMVRSEAMSFASPFPDVEIPTASVYDYLFGDIDDADADRVALVDAKSGSRDQLPRDGRAHRRVRRCAGRPRHRRRRRRRACWRRTVPRSRSPSTASCARAPRPPPSTRCSPPRTSPSS